MSDARVLLMITVIVTFVGLVNLAIADSPTYKGHTVLFGNLHAHSALSDDVSDPANELTPDKAFTYARKNGLDFLALSDHHKATDSSHRLSMTQSEYKNQLYDVAASHSADADFIAIAGIEWGNTASGNHLNVFGSDTLPPDSIKDQDYDALYAWAGDNAEFVQLNHPYSWGSKSNRNQDVGNFGSELYADTATFVELVGP